MKQATDFATQKIRTFENKLSRAIDKKYQMEGDIRDLKREIEKLHGELETAKEDLVNLQKAAFDSDDSNIVTLRNELLLATKLIIDQE